MSLRRMPLSASFLPPKGLAFAAAALLVAAASAARAEYDSASRWIWGAAEAQ